MTRALTKTLLKELVRIQDKRFRHTSGLFLIEGTKMIEEWLQSSWTAAWLVVTEAYVDRHPGLMRSLVKLDVPVWTATEAELRKIADSETPQGIAVALHRPEVTMEVWSRECSGSVLFLDGIQDPGNLGTILRTADWFGISYVSCSRDCADAFSPKVVRSTMGSIFRVSILSDADGRVIESLRRRGYRWYASVSAHPDVTSFEGGAIGLVIGNESRGISEGIDHLCDHRITIPRKGSAESLNAAMACGILLYQLQQETYVAS